MVSGVSGLRSDDGQRKLEVGMRKSEKLIKWQDS